MKTQNPYIDTILEAQTQAVSNWMDTTKKFQNAFTGGKIQADGQSIYNEWLEKQMSIFGGIQANFNPNAATEGFAKPEEFFKNWYSQQTENIKKMTDFNQSIYSSVLNYGKSANDYTSTFSNMNSVWTNIYNNWMSALNNSFESLMKNMPGVNNQDIFKKMFESNKVYLQLQELYSPAFKAWQNMDFSNDSFKKFFDAEAYKKVTESLFGQYFNRASLDEVFEQSIKNIHNFFVSQNGLSKEYYTAFQSISKEFPQLVSGDFAKLSELYTDGFANVFGKSFSPVLNLVGASKDKENVEATIQLMDRIAEYSVKQAQFQYHYYVAGQKAMEGVSKEAFEKLQKGATETQGFNEFYNQWVKANEATYTDLYNSEEFSKLKSELLTISADVKRTFEKQFEGQFNMYPVVFRSEVEELHKTIYDLKKQVKALEAKLSVNSVEAEEEEKSSKKAAAKK